MAAPSPSLSLDTVFDPHTGMAVRVGPSMVRVTAPNRGPDGTSVQRATIQLR